MRRVLVRQMRELGEVAPRATWIVLTTSGALIAGGQMGGLAGEILVALVLTAMLAVSWRAPRAAAWPAQPRVSIVLRFDGFDARDVAHALDMIEGRIRSESHNGDIIHRLGARSLVMMPEQDPSSLENMVQLAFRLQRIAARRSATTGATSR